MLPKNIAWAFAAVAALGSLVYVVSCVNDSNQTDPCPKYCADIQATCSGDNAQFPTTDNNATCLRICTGINQLDSGTNSIACRALNLSSAKDETDPQLKHDECVGAGVSAINCGASQCAAFCEIVLSMCGSTSPPPYAKESDCLDACGKWPATFTGQLIGSVGDNLECRTYHFELSQTGQPSDLITHCAHTGAVSARCNNATSDAGADAATDAASDAASDASGD